MSAGNNATNSWTIVSPEETVAETVRPLEEGIKHEQDNDDTPTGEQSNQPAEGVESSSNLQVEDHQVAEKRKADPIGDSSTDHPPSFVKDAPVPSGDNQSEAPPDGSIQDTFSDSVSHATPCCDEPLGSLMSTETLGGVELTQQERQHKELLEKCPGQKGEEPDLLSKYTDYAAQPGSGKEKAEGNESERKRLLDSLEKIGRVDEEEEGEEEEFQLPQQRRDDSMFSLNKCILGAVFLVGLGTVFFSESDFSAKEPRDLKEAGKQEWLHPDAENSHLLAELAKENRQISVLQAQLEAQKEKLKAAEGQVAQSETERLHWLEENSRLKSKVASLPVLQKENERLKKEMETLPTLENELKTLRSTVTKLTVPPSGQPSDSKQHGKIEEEKDNKGEKKESSKSEWKESEKKESKDGSRKERERKESGSDKRAHGPSDKVKDGEGKRVGEKDSKKERRGDEGKMWKEQDGKKPHAERKEWKKDKHEKHEKQWGRKEEMKWRKDEGETHKEKDKWKKKNQGKDDFLESGEEKNWKNKDGKGRRGERKHVENTKKQDGETDERKQWGQKGKSDKDWQKSGAKSKRKVDSGELKGERSKLLKHKLSEHHHEENMWAERKSGKQQSSADPSDYWSQQRKRLHRKPKQPQHCHSQEACAQAEGLRPVSFPQFQSFLQEYLAKAEQAGVDSSKRDELQKLVAEFFQDGVFMHDRVNFRKFVKDLSDILEDMVEGDEEDSDLEEEMEEFGREALRKFLVAGSGGERQKGELKKESARASG
ncbi:pre-B-cell leukemia homeobox interacting protein 1b isoform X2 [Stigmatopora nigra]